LAIIYNYTNDAPTHERQVNRQVKAPVALPPGK